MSIQITKKAQSFQKSTNPKNKNKICFKSYHFFKCFSFIVISSHHPCFSSQVQTRPPTHNCYDESGSVLCTNIISSKEIDGLVVYKKIENEEGDIYSLTQGVESCPNFLESETEKYPILTTRQHRKMKEKTMKKLRVDDINTNLKFGKDVLNAILEQLTYNFDYDDKNDDNLKKENNQDSDLSRRGKKQKFFKDLRYRLLSFASATSSSTAIAGLTIDPTIASASMAAAHMEASQRQQNEIKNDKYDILETRSPSSMLNPHSLHDKERDQISKPGSTKSRYPGGKIVKTIHVEKEETYSIPAVNSKDFHHQMELIEGSQLLSASLGFISSSIGLVADSVRIVGETTAGVAGSSVRLAGTAVKSISNGLYIAGDLVEGTAKEKYSSVDQNVWIPNRQKKRRPLTSVKLGIDLGLENQSDGDHNISYEANNGFLDSSRTVAGKTVRLAGSIAQGVGDSLILAGSVTETITSSTAAIAEETVRVVEDFVGSLSMYFNLHDSLLDEGTESDSAKHNEKADNKPNDVTNDKTTDPPLAISDVDLSSFPPPGVDDSKKLSTSYITYGRRDENKMQTTHQSKLPTKIQSNQNDANTPYSLHTEVGDFLEYLFSDTEGVPSLAHNLLGVFTLLYVLTFVLVWFKFKRKYESPNNLKVGRQGIIVKNSLDSETSEREDKKNSGDNYSDKKWAPFSIFGLFIRILLLPFACFIKILFSPYILLLSIYVVAFTYLSIKLQMNADEIKRYAEMTGYRAAIISTQYSATNTIESAAWLNSVLAQVWQVSPIEIANADIVFDWEENTYGGLEPLLSSFIGETLIDAMSSTYDMQQNDVAYVSLDSITLGSMPPIIKSIEILSVYKEKNEVNLSLDVDALLATSNLVLDIKLSALDYALLPSTKLSINSLDLRASVSLSISFLPTYPYISTVVISMEKIPKYKVKITPLNESSGLKGINLASIPLLNKWLAESVDLALEPFISPQYVSIDIAAYLLSPKDKVDNKGKQVTHRNKQTKVNNKNILQSRRMNRKGVPQSLSASQAATKKSFFTKLSPMNSRQTTKRQDNHNEVLSEECPNPEYPLLNDANDHLSENDSGFNVNDIKREKDLQADKQFRNYFLKNIRRSLAILGPVTLLSFAGNIFDKKGGS